MIDAEHEDEIEELVLCTRDKDKAHDLVVIVLRSFYPELNEELEGEEVVKTAPEQSVQLLAKRGKKFIVLGPVGWWLYVKKFDEDVTGYIPSTHVAPITDDLSCDDEAELNRGGQLSPEMVNQSVDLKYFPLAPVEKDILNRDPCPEESANFLSKLTFWWLNWLIRTGHKRPLEDKDLWALPRSLKSSQVVPKFEQRWNNELSKFAWKCCGCLDCHCKESPKEIETDKCSDKKGDVPAKETPEKEADQQVEDLADGEKVEFVPKKEEKADKEEKKVPMPSLMKVLFLMFWPQTLLASFLKFLHDILQFVQPIVLGMLMTYIEAKDSGEVWRGYVFALIMFSAAVTQSLLLHQYFHVMLTVGAKVKTAVTGMVYSKALRLNNASRGKSTAGDMVNLMSVDAQRLNDMCSYINILWSAPVQIMIALYLLYDTMGVATFAGVVVMVLLIPFNFFVGKAARSLQVKQMGKKDLRIRIMNEILNGIKVLKLYAWEESFLAKVSGIRLDELKHLKNAMYLNAAFSFTFTCAPFLVSLATFTIFVLTGNELTAKKAFVALSIFNILRFPLTVLPNVIASLVQAMVSVQRLSDFFCLEELKSENVQRTMPSQFANQSIHVENGTFAWNHGDQSILNDINLNIPSGSLVAVVGQVGCGKSTLLSALLGETEKVNGQVYVQGSVASVPQQAWIQNATLRDNIIYGRNFESKRYHKCVKACALETDFDILPGGDMTEIGERGINLSGGQKQRINLARAVYFNADVYLFDDPLSAVDSHVGKHLFDKVIGPRGKLRHKTRVLVTHAISVLPQVDQIVVLQGGRISEIGTYEQLQANQGAFAEFLKTFAAEDKEETTGDTTFPIQELPDEEEKEENEDAGEVDILAQLHRQTSEIEDELDGPPTIMPHRPVLRRRDSTVTMGTTITCDTADTDGMTIAEEERDVDMMIFEERAEKGSVKLSVFWTYAKSIGVIISFIFLLFILASEGCLVGSRIWLANWSADPDTSDKKRDLYLGVYGGLGFAQATCVLVSSVCLAFGSIRASRYLHDSLLINILHSPMAFFETTPIGRVVNRFSKDLYTIDDAVPRSLSGFLRMLLSVSGTLFAICFATPLFLAVIVPLAIVYIAIQRWFVATSRQLRRIESVTRSPVYNYFYETVNGASTIRAYHQQQRFTRGSFYKVDENQLAFYPMICSNRWLAVRLEFIGNLIILFAALFAVVGKDSIESSLVGMSITYALQITQALNMMVRMSSELETNIVSVERTKEYADLPTEANWIIDNHRPPDDWPASGNITFDSFDLRYRENLPLVLKNINVDIKPGEKIGIVGRTGAGKSTLTLALFRLLESAGGRIIVDDQDISKMGLHDLRSRLTIIPQDPVLFSGTLRFNLDPFDKHSDDELWNVLEVSHLKQFVSSLAEGLLHAVTEGGENLSVGQRQLVCLARALLRKSKVLVLDEATAAVDLETDELIQNTIRTEFADRTTLTIAHRLNTIMDYSRILVLDKGFMMEFDSPAKLIQQRGIFFGMAQDAGLA